MTPESTDRVRPLDPPFRWLVESTSNPQEPYTVDIAEHDGMGECACTDWITRKGPRIKAGERTPTLYCKHVKIAREQCLNLAIWKYNQDQREK